MSPPMEEIISKFVRKHLDLLKLERDENIQHVFKDLSPVALRKLEKDGQALTKLSVNSLASKGLKQMQIDFVDANNLPLKHAFVVGDLVVCMKSGGRSELLRGLVASVSERTLSVSLTEQTSNVDEEGEYSVIRADSDYTYNCQTRALKALESTNVFFWRCFSTIRMLFDDDPKVVEQLLEAEIPIPEKFLADDGSGIIPLNPKLASDQLAAVTFALRRKHLAIIQGPPGTGKTTTLVELIGQLCQLGKKVLVCAPTNVAVDNIVGKLSMSGTKPLRIGHPARVAKDAKNFTVDANVSLDGGYEILMGIKQSIKDLLEKQEDGKKRTNYREINRLNKEYHERMNKLTVDIIKRHSVIACTLNSATSGKYSKALRHVPHNYFDVVVVDEASQATEASTWIAIPNAAKLVLAGDINQLPPAVMNQNAANNGLSLSLMERAIKKLGARSFRSLEIQYRMNQKIMAWSSKQFYNDTLKADKLVENHLVCDINGVEACPLTTDSIVFVDTCGCECEEYQSGTSTISKGNVGEAVVVDRIVASLVKAGVSSIDIGVITPYALQVDFIRRMLSARLIVSEVSTVDGFQGREKEVIVLSLVRSNEEKELGFVTDFRRLNVAVTRARRLLVVVANSETVEDNKLITSLLKHIEDQGFLQTAQEYLGEDSEDVKSELEKNVKAKQKNSSTADNKIEKRNKKPPAKSKPIDNEANDVKSVLSEKGSDLSQSLNRKNYNPFECISGNTSEVEIVEDAEALEDAPDLESAVPGEKNETANVASENVTTPTISAVKTEPKPEIKLANLMASLNYLQAASVPGTSKIVVPQEKKKPTTDKQIDDLADVLVSAMLENNICSMSDCKQSTKLMHLDCEFCKRRFCLKHGMQEIHGCGDAVRRKEQKDFRHRKPERCRQQDKDRFAKKIRELEEARKPKKKTTKKK